MLREMGSGKVMSVAMINVNKQLAWNIVCQYDISRLSEKGGQTVCSLVKLFQMVGACMSFIT